MYLGPITQPLLETSSKGGFLIKARCLFSNRDFSGWLDLFLPGANVIVLMQVQCKGRYFNHFRWLSELLFPAQIL